MTRVAYIHGFSSNPQSSKATALAALLKPAGITLHVPDLNVPSFPQLRISAMRAVLDAMDTPGDPWLLVGSSLGGYLATLWASEHPARVTRLLLLAPAFDVPTRWRDRHGDAGMHAWQSRGTLTVPDPNGRPAALHYGFYEDACTLPPWPKPPCDTVVWQGTRDDVVAPATAARFARENANVSVHTVDDDHLLLSTIDAVAADVAAHV